MGFISVDNVDKPFREEREEEKIWKKHGKSEDFGSGKMKKKSTFQMFIKQHLKCG